MIGIAVSGVVVALLIGGALALLVYVDRSVHEVVANPWDELTTTGRHVVTGVAYALLLLGLVGLVTTLRALATWI